MIPTTSETSFISIACIVWSGAIDGDFYEYKPSHVSDY